MNVFNFSGNIVAFQVATDYTKNYAKLDISPCNPLL